MTDYTLQKTPLEGLYLIQQKVFCDERGRFARLFCQSRLTAQGRPLRSARSIIRARSGRAAYAVCIIRKPVTPNPS